MEKDSEKFWSALPLALEPVHHFCCFPKQLRHMFRGGNATLLASRGSCVMGELLAKVLGIICVHSKNAVHYYVIRDCQHCKHYIRGAKGLLLSQRSSIPTHICRTGLDTHLIALLLLIEGAKSHVGSSRQYLTNLLILAIRPVLSNTSSSPPRQIRAYFRFMSMPLSTICVDWRMSKLA